MLNCTGCLYEGKYCVVHSFNDVWLRQYAHNLIDESLKNLPTRKAHTEAVAKRMEDLLGNVSPFIKSYGYVVGLLHDIGYGHPNTGHHAIDGALHTNNTILSDLAPYIAWHSTSKYEATARGMTVSFDKPFNMDIHDKLWYADFTTSPAGERITVHKRLNEIRTRYSPDSQVIQALNNSEKEMNEIFRKFGEIS